jgi:hypothetical protein
MFAAAFLATVWFGASLLSRTGTQPTLAGR